MGQDRGASSLVFAKRRHIGVGDELSRGQPER